MTMGLKPVEAHISGTVARVDAPPGTHVKEGDTVVTIESMKMEMPIEAPKAGRVAEVRVEAGQFVNDGDIVALIE
jgi:acetyl-CoA carboxylase biotin carboxyl carrier protein